MSTQGGLSEVELVWEADGCPQFKVMRGKTAKGKWRYFVSHNANTVMVALVDKARRTFRLVKQHRVVVDDDTLECVGGKVDPCENRMVEAVRELNEEVGLELKLEQLMLGNWRDSTEAIIACGECYPQPGYDDDAISIFVVFSSAKPVASAKDEDVDTVLECSIDEVKTLVRNGKIKDSRTCTVILHALLWFELL